MLYFEKSNYLGLFFETFSKLDLRKANSVPLQHCSNLDKTFDLLFSTVDFYFLIVRINSVKLTNFLCLLFIYFIKICILGESAETLLFISFARVEYLPPSTFSFD